MRKPERTHDEETTLTAGATTVARTTALVLSSIAVASAACPTPHLQAQTTTRGPELVFDTGFEEHDAFAVPPLHRTEPYVIIRLEENQLYIVENGRPVWSAPVGTGTGFALEADGRSWEFDTPRGVFRVQHKEKDPIWIKPDWAYLKYDQDVPPLNSPERRQEGMLGTSAVYIGYELALHGTDRPELVLAHDPEERRVSHGCIRLTNEDARALFHLVEIGTPVLIY